MGLDITAYSNLKPVGQHIDTDQWCEDEDHVHAYAYDAFPRSFRGIPVLGTTHGWDASRFLEGGCYATTDSTETHGFRAGSYSGYCRWRADLQAQFNPHCVEDGPFYELIYFADNEGTIGPEAAADLLADFRTHAERYMSPQGWGTGSVYNDWTRAFELAAVDGLVSFH